MPRLKINALGADDLAEVVLIEKVGEREGEKERKGERDRDRVGR